MGRTNHNFSQRDTDVIGKCAQRMVDIINESKKLAKNSKNIATRISRLQVARDKLEELRGMVRQYPFLKLFETNEVELELEEIAREIEGGNYRAIADANEDGQQLERNGLTEDAMKKYEEIIAGAVDTPFPYRRLAILYRKKRMFQDEKRVLMEAIKNIPASNAAHFKWFDERYKKMPIEENT